MAEDTNDFGVVDGEVLPTQEVIIYDQDDDGNVVGWHKETV
jgi:hypothetical protein